MNSEALARACQWVDTNLEKFAIGADPTAIMATLKATTELFHAADYLVRTDDERWIAIGERWKAYASRQVGEGALVRGMLAASPRNLVALVAWVPFHLAGMPDPGLTPLIIRGLRGQVIPPLIWTIVGPALRMLGIPWQDTGVRVGGKPISMLAWRVSPQVMPQDAAYLLAHECMYVTKWGLEASTLDTTTSVYVAEALPALALRFAHDADLVAELIMATHALHLPCASPDAWRVLERAQTEAGNIDGPAPDSMFQRFPHPSLGRTYHTTLAAIMAWSGHLRPGAH
ncbi:MAG: hypothetical protein AB7T06_15635 [Kofleriaceae bacterium]